ncbi:MAG: hypothetical protein CM15mP1_1320 [Methanobacteriota archaeon]|nr:MAG: hypothetical protein CM15mP1_1320 [Euryarchaeota archaeon]
MLKTTLLRTFLSEVFFDVWGKHFDETGNCFDHRGGIMR